MLIVRDLDVSRGERRLMTELSFELEPGQMALVVGPNGCGKTSLLRVLAGLAPPAAGAIEFEGCGINDLTHEQRAGFSYRGHLDGLKKQMTIRENLDVSAALRAFSGSYDTVLDELELGSLADRQVRYLSAGQRRRAGLAALQVANARLWLLDEPMTNLDHSGRQLVAGWIQKHVSNGGSAIIATHQPDALQHAGSLLIEF